MSMYLGPMSRIGGSAPSQKYKVVYLGQNTQAWNNTNTISYNIASLTSDYPYITIDNFIVDPVAYSYSSPRGSYSGTYNIASSVDIGTKNYREDTGYVSLSGTYVYAYAQPTVRRLYTADKSYFLKPIQEGETEDTIIKIGSHIKNDTNIVIINVSDYYNDFTNLSASNFLMNITENGSASKSVYFSNQYYQVIRLVKNVTYNAQTGELTVELYGAGGFAGSSISSYPAYDIWLWVSSE